MSAQLLVFHVAQYQAHSQEPNKSMEVSITSLLNQEEDLP